MSDGGCWNPSIEPALNQAKPIDKGQVYKLIHNRL
jgi:hypothetical protein